MTAKTKTQEDKPYFISEARHCYSNILITGATAYIERVVDIGPKGREVRRIRLSMFDSDAWRDPEVISNMIEALEHARAWQREGYLSSKAITDARR